MEYAMATAATAWRNGAIWAEQGMPAGGVETYRAAYIKRFDFGPQPRLMAAANLGVFELLMAIEDAELDLIGFADA